MPAPLWQRSSKPLLGQGLCGYSLGLDVSGLEEVRYYCAIAAQGPMVQSTRYPVRVKYADAPETLVFHTANRGPGSFGTKSSAKEYVTLFQTLKGLLVATLRGF